MKFLINLLFASLLSVGLFGQSEKEVKQRDQIMEAESYFYYEEYSDALPLFLKLKKQFPDNYNFLYKIRNNLIHNEQPSG